MANKIVVANQRVAVSTIDDSISLQYKESYLPKLCIHVLENSSLTLQFEQMIDAKWEVEVHISKGKILQLIETKTGEKGKIQFRYTLEEDSHLELTKIHDVTSFGERDFFSLNGENSKVTSILKTVVTEKEKYDMTVCHNASHSESNIINHGVDSSGVLQFNVTTQVPLSIIQCVANQTNRIVNLTNNHCVIRPNLLIDEYDVEANHSAYIGPFTAEEMFYIERLGIAPALAQKLLLQSFMNAKVDTECIQILEKYWR